MNLIEKDKERKKDALHIRRFMKRISPLIDFWQNGGDLSSIHQDGSKLGYLVANLRSLKNRGELDESEVMFLDGIGMDWGFSFEKAVEPLIKAFKKYGNLDAIDRNQEIIVDGEVINILRTKNWLWKMAQKNKLKKSQIDYLKMLGIEVSPQSIDSMLKPFVAYLAKDETRDLEHMRTNESIEIDGKIINIGRRLATYRVKYKNGTLREGIEQALCELDPNWNAKIKQKELDL